MATQRVGTIQRFIGATFVAAGLLATATPASAETVEFREGISVKPIGPDYSKPWMEPVKPKLPWWYRQSPTVNTAPQLDREHPPLCIGNTYYARFTDAESPTADLRVMFNYQNTSGEHVSVRMTMRPGVEDHVVTVTDLQEQPHRADNMFSIFAWDPEGAYFAQWVNGDCLTNGDESGVPS